MRIMHDEIERARLRVDDVRVRRALEHIRRNVLVLAQIIHQLGILVLTQDRARVVEVTRVV